MLYFGTIFAALAAAAGVLYLRRLRSLRAPGGVALTDEMIRRIEEDGVLPVREDEEEPLDWEEIHDEERRFWEETWDEPEDA